MNVRRTRQARINRKRAQTFLTHETLESRRLLAQTPTLLASNILTSGGFTEFNGDAYFSARGRETSASPLTGLELWKTDGVGSVTLVKDITPGAGNGGPREITAFNGKLFFAARDNSTGIELWESDGTENGTKVVIDIAPGGTSSSVSQLTVVGSQLFFLANDGPAGTELWKSDGTASGTKMVIDLVPGSGSATIDSLTAVGDRLFFAATLPGAVGSELYTSDGAAAGTKLVKQINPSGPSDPRSLFAWNNRLYFSAVTQANGRELWMSDGTSGGTEMVGDIATGGTSSLGADVEFEPLGNRLYFSAQTAAFGLEPWYVNASGGAAILKDINPGAANSDPDFIGAFRNRVAFTATLGASNSTYLAGGGIADVADFTAIVGVSPDDALHVGEDALIFTNGIGYWLTDGTQAGTELVAEPLEGVGESAIIGDRVVFMSGSRIFSFPVNFGAPNAVAGSYTLNEGNPIALNGTASSDPNGDNLTFSWDLDGNDNFADASGPTPTLSWTQLNTFGITDDGSYTIKMRVQDPVGNVSIDSGTILVVNVAPSLNSVSVPVFSRVNNSISLVANATDVAADPLTYRWGFGDGNTATGPSVQHTFTTVGEFTITLEVSDDEGAKQNFSQKITVQTVAPDAEAGGLYTLVEGGEVTLNATGSTDPNGLPLAFAWELDGDGDFDDALTITPRLGWSNLVGFGIDDDGEYLIRVRVSDPSGVSAEDVATLTVTNLPPVITQFDAPDGGLASETYSFIASASDPAGAADPVTYAWDFGDGSPLATGANVNHTFASAGTFQVTLTVSDDDGGKATATNSITLDAVSPVASAGGPYTLLEGGELSLNASASIDPNGDALAFGWDLDGDGAFDDAIGATPTVTWANLGSLTPAIGDDGVYSIAVQVLDTSGNRSVASTTLTVNNANPTIVNVSVPTIAEVNKSVAFGGTISDFGGANDPLTTTWNFGDGTLAVTGTLSQTHTFTKTGTYDVTLTVVDDDGGSASTTRSIEITDVSNPPAIQTGGPYSINEGEVLVLDPTESTDPLGRTLVYLWDLDRDGIGDVSSFGARSVSWQELVSVANSIADDGVHVIDLVVASLSDSDVVLVSTTLTIRNLPPTIESSIIPPQASTNRNTVFSVTAKDPNEANDALVYNWDFGDGTSGDGASVGHVFTNVGPQTVSLTVSDGDGGVATSSWVVQVIEGAPLEISAVDDAIDVVSDSTAAVTVDLLDNDTGTGQGALVVSAVEGGVETTVAGAYGSLTWNADGVAGYTLDTTNVNINGMLPGETLLDLFRYTATDGGGNATAELVVTITGAEIPIVTVDDPINLSSDSANPVAVNVLANDTAGVGSLFVTEVNGTTNNVLVGDFGSLTWNANGIFTYALNLANTDVASLPAGATLTEGFAYKVVDERLNSTGTVVVTITGAGTPATAVNDSIQLLSDVTTPRSVNVLSNDKAGTGGLKVADVAGSTASVVSGKYGSLTWNANGIFAYSLDRANAAVRGLQARATLVDEFVYRATDDAGEATASLIVTITGATETVAPTVTGSQRGDGVTVRYDQLTKYTLSFSENVSASIEAGDLQIVDVKTGQAVDTAGATVVWDPSTNSATWDLSSLGLDIGRYRIFVASDAVSDPSGNVLASEFAQEEVLTWKGDTDLDLDVDFADFLKLSNNFGEVETGWMEGNFDGLNGTVFPDFLALSDNFGKGIEDDVAAAFAQLEDDAEWWGRI